MQNQLTAIIPSIDLDIRKLGRYLIIPGLILTSLLLWALFNKPIIFGAAIVSITALITVSNPKLALYQFIFFLFMNLGPLTSLDIPIVELSGSLLILAAAFDLFLHPPVSISNVPRLTYNYLFLLAAIVMAGIFSQSPPLAIHMFGRVLFLLVLFWSLYRLAGKTTVLHLLKVYLVICTLHAVIIVGQFLLSGGEARAFGFSHIIYDELAMLGLPIAVTLFCFSLNRRRWLYLTSSFLIFIALVATQSRAPIAFGLFGCLLTLFLVRRSAKKLLLTDDAESETMKAEARRALQNSSAIVFLFIIAVAAIAVLKTDLLTTVSERFERLWTTTPGGTFAMRLTLWKTALTMFEDNPLLGLGPGMFKQAGQFYSSMHFDPTYYWVRDLSAHNMTLHYLAETGLIGTVAMLSLFVQQFRLAKTAWRSNAKNQALPISLALLVVSSLILITTLLEAGWLWGYTGSIAIFFFVLIVRQNQKFFPS